MKVVWRDKLRGVAVSDEKEGREEGAVVVVVVVVRGVMRDGGRWVKNG